MKVGKDGTLLLPEEQRKRWGLKPGADVLVWETPEGLVLRPADPPLAKIYLEPTTTCNLQCSTCMRNSWDEPGGTMSLASCNHCDCDMAEANEEDCFGSPFPTCGDCLWARGIVLCP